MLIAFISAASWWSHSCQQGAQWIYTETKTQDARDMTSLACAPAYFIGGALRWGVFQPPGMNWRKRSTLSLLWQRLERCRDSLQRGLHYYKSTKHARHYATQLLAAFPQMIWDEVDDKTIREASFLEMAVTWSCFSASCLQIQWILKLLSENE